MVRVWTLFLISFFGFALYNDKADTAQVPWGFEGTRLAQEFSKGSDAKPYPPSQYPVRNRSSLPANDCGGEKARDSPLCIYPAKDSEAQFGYTSRHFCPGSNAFLVQQLLRKSPQQSSFLPRVWRRSADLYNYTWTTELGAAPSQTAVSQSSASILTKAKGRWRGQGRQWSGCWERQVQHTSGSKGKGKGAPPKIADLPQPALTPSIQVPKTGSGSTAEASEEGELLGALLAHLGDPATLPAALAERVQTFQSANARSTGKLLHKQVARQTEARTQLQKLAKEKQAFLEGWAEYLKVLTETVEQQVSKMSNVLEDFGSAESQWQAQLADATDLLTKATSHTSAPRSVEAMDAEDATVAQAAAEDSRTRLQTEKIQQGQKELIEALNKAKAAAEVHRDGSRTPRRKPKEDEIVDLERHPQFLNSSVTMRGLRF